MPTIKQSIVRGAVSAALTLSFIAPAFTAHAASVNLMGGDLIKLPDDHNTATNVDAAIYYFGLDGLRYVFPNSKTYFTWYANFNGVKEVTLEQMGTIGIGGNVTYRPGKRMIKIDSDPRVYAIDRGGMRRAIPTEAVASALYGSTWNKMIDDVPDSFFSNYKEGVSLVTASEFAPGIITELIQTISTDKNLSSPLEVTINTDGSYSPKDVSVTLGRTVRFTNNSSIAHRLASDPHPTHDTLPGFDSADIPPGLNYVYKFKQVGAWGYHNHKNISLTGSVTVNQ